MSGLWGDNRSGAAPTKGKTASAVTCFMCDVALKRFTPSLHPVCSECAVLAVRARLQLEREKVLPKHGFNLTGVYTHPLVVERARALKAAA